MPTTKTFWESEFGKIVKVALYIIGSSAITGLIDWIGAMDLSESSVITVAVVGIVNLILVAANKLLFKKK